MTANAPPHTATITQQFLHLQQLARTPGFAHYEQRIARLRALQRLLQEQEDAILQALASDLGKSRFEGYLTEIALVNEDIRYSLKKLKRWIKPQRVASPLATFISRSAVLHEPLGTVLIIAPWNYPFQLLIAPLIGALAAGNSVVLKPSELAPHTSALVARLIKQYFHAGDVIVIEGAQQETSTLADLPFDHIFFTGSTQVGAIIAAQAARNLTPVTLELGGKSPCVLLSEKHLDTAAKRIAWGKQLNSGQTCVAPDYLLIKQGLQARFVERYRYWLEQFYGADILASAQLGKIVSPRHFARLQQLLAGHKVLWSAGSDSSRQVFGPTLVEIDHDSPRTGLMEEEIFGPLLPLLEVASLDEAIAIIATKPKPLAAYLFSDTQEDAQAFSQNVRAGGLCINDVVVHLTNKHLPFGGVGPSGAGAYHGWYSFATFSHAKAIMRRSFYGESSLRYLPAGNKLGLIKKLLPWLS